MLTTAGLHVPFTPLVEAVGRAGTEAPAQMEIDVPKENVGTVFGLTVTVKLVVVAHVPAEGVKV